MLNNFWTKLNKNRFNTGAGVIFSIVSVAILTLLLFLTYRELRLINPDPISVIGLTLTTLVLFLLIGIFFMSNFVRNISLFIKGSKRRVSKLRKRIIIAFSLGAAVPTIIVAVFSTYFFNFGIRAWFDSKITAVLDQSVIVAESYISENVLQMKETALSVANDLNDMYYKLIHNTELFTQVLNAQAEMRSLDEAIVFQKSTNTILAQTSLSFSLSFASIPAHIIKRADKGEIINISGDQTKIRVLIKLKDYNNTYLLIGKAIDPQIIDHINKTDGAAAEYYRLKNQIVSMQIKFSIIFILVAMILIISAIIWGRNFAERIVKPIRELVIAAEKVKNGDLTIQVPEDDLKKDEIKVLSSAFNRMVKQIDLQQKDLLVAQRALAWSDVARRVAHEIKNPLTPIQLSAEILIKRYKKEVSDQSGFDKYVNNIIRHSNDIKNIVSEFVNFARMPAPRFTVCDIVSLVNDLVESRKLINYKIYYNFTSNINKFDLVCDVSQINQVMVNLMQNAEEALTQSKPNNKVEVEIDLQDELLFIMVSDNGNGFSKAVLAKATEAYVTTKENGTGLGLAIVQRIIQDHFGEINIFNNSSGGATIKLMFNTKLLKNKLK